MPVLLHELSKSGVKDENIMVVVTTGMHKPDITEEIKQNVGEGEEIVKRVNVTNH